jgi:antitoxin ParD1/3/4
MSSRSQRHGTSLSTSLQISLPEALGEYVSKRVAEGAYRDPSDFVRALIHADREREAKRQALLRDLQVGIDQLDRGEGITGEEVVRRLEEKFGKAE